MALRIYLSKLTGTGLGNDPVRAVWWDLIDSPASAHGVTESLRYHFWIGQIDTTAEQHATLVADSRIRTISSALLDTAWGDLTAAQRSAAAEVVTWLGFDTRAASDVFANTCKVRDVLFWILGKSCWTGLKGFEEPQGA